MLFTIPYLPYCGSDYKWSVLVILITQFTGSILPVFLQLQDDMELAERTLTSISKHVNHLIQKAEKQQPNSLIILLEES
ncbi:hypothetical protein Hanom_Chr08g00708211 [Helianthus anomalus]